MNQGAPITVLRRFGVPLRDIAVLQRAGPVLPFGADNRGDILFWALLWLPWDWTWPILARWTSEAVGLAQLDADVRVKALADCLCTEPNRAVAGYVYGVAVEMATSLERRVGKCDRCGECHHPVVQAWRTVGASARAARLASMTPAHDRACSIADAAMQIVHLSQDRDAATDAAICDAISALARFVRSWTPEVGIA